MTTFSNLTPDQALAELRWQLPPCGPLKEARLSKDGRQLLVRVDDLAEQLKPGSALNKLCPGLRYAGWPVKPYEERWEPTSTTPRKDGDDDDEDLTMTARTPTKKPLKELSHRELDEAQRQNGLHKAETDLVNLGLLTTTTRDLVNGRHGAPPANGQPTAGPTAQVRSIELALLSPSATNPRKHFDEGKLKELADSIRVHGVLQAILVRPQAPPLTGFQVVAGERRYRAAKIAGLFALPCVVRHLTDAEVREVQIIENLQREDLDPFEEAAGFQSLMQDLGMKAADVADRCGKKRSYVFAALKLLQLEEGYREDVRAANLTRSVAELIARVPDPKQREEFGKECLGGEYGDGPLTYKDAKDLLHREFMRELKKPPFPLGLVETHTPAGRTDVFTEAGSCDACPKKTGNQPELYPDSRPDVCTDPACYQRKAEAWQARQFEEAEKKHAGTPLLAEAVCKKIFPAYSPTSVAWDANFVDLAEQPAEDPKKRSWKKILEEALGAEHKLGVGAIDQKGKLHRLAPKAQAVQALNKLTGKRLPTGASSGGGYNPAANDRKWAERREEAKAIAGRFDARLPDIRAGIRKVLAGVSAGPDSGLAFLRHLVCHDLQYACDREVEKLRKAAKDVKTGYELFCLWAEAKVLKDLAPRDHYHDAKQDKETHQVLQPLGVDWLAEVKQACEQLKQKEKVKKPAAAGKKAKVAS